jgi:hypothetical protein
MPLRNERSKTKGSYQVVRICKEKSCQEFFNSSRFDAIRAKEAGWFEQKNGDVWCPAHIPDWVAGWRASKKKQD